MVLGLGLKKGATIRVEFQIQVQEIKPWRGVGGANAPLLLQWQRGDNRSGKTRSVVPKQEDGGKLVFNDSFRLPAKLVREATGKGRNARIAKFQKKTIVFVLQAATTGEQLARCVVDLAEYGDLQSSVPASIPLALAKKDSGGPTPSLFLTIGPLGKDVRSFASRVSFNSSSPRTSISKASDKTVSTSGKSKIEPALDEDTRASIVAALASDEDDDDVSMESFTDDESTPEESTPRLGKDIKSPTPESEKTSTSTTPPKSEVPKPSVAGADKSRSSSSPAEAAVISLTDSPFNLPTHDRPTPTKHGPGKAVKSPAFVASEEATEKSRHTPRKRSVSAEEIPMSFNAAPFSIASITQLFSTEPVYKSTEVAEDSAVKLASRPGSGSPSESESQSSKVTKRPLIPEQRDEDVTFNGSRSKILVSTSEHPLILPNKTTDKAGWSTSFAESQKAGDISRTEWLHSSREAGTSAKADTSQESAAPVKTASAASAAASAASAYIASRTFKSFEDPSFDYMSETSEDAYSESSHGGRSPAQSPLRDQPQVSGRSVLSSQPSVDAKVGEKKEADRSTGSDAPDTREKKSDESNTASSKSQDVKKGVVKQSETTSPDMKKIVDGKLDTKREGAGTQEEPTEQGASVLLTARANLAKMEKRTLEELRTKIAHAEAKLLAESQKLEKLQGELRDIGAMEVSLYCVVAEHGNSSHKLHSPARRIARLYVHACQYWSPERRAGTVKNSVSGLVTVAKSCGSDVSRLTFWWSNVVALRTVVTQGSSKPSQGDKLQASPKGSVNGNGSTGWARARRSVAGSAAASFNRRVSAQTPPTTPKPRSVDWQEASSYIAALEKIEEWIYSKIVESLWWQAMIPRMQKGMDASTPTSPKGMALLSPSSLFGPANDDLSKLAGDVTGIFVKKQGRRSINLPELGDARQGNMSVEVWKKAIMEALRRLCPVRGAGHECGCLPMLIKMAIEGCVARLDVALFNAILREPDDDVPTDPFSDPVSDSSVLPISPGGLTFGGGSQLKNVVVTWSTFISGVLSVKEPSFVPDADDGDNTDTLEDSEKLPRFFNLLKATGDLLMLPKDILMDRGIRKEETRPETETITDPNLFVMLRTTGDILQLPKDLLMDKSVRRELNQIAAEFSVTLFPITTSGKLVASWLDWGAYVAGRRIDSENITIATICPMLSLQLIRRILLNFVPDEFAPDPISPSLLAALNAEVSLEKQRQGEADSFSSSTVMAAAPPIVYFAPSAEYVWSWIGEASVDPSCWGKSTSSLLRKGYTSDDDLTVMEQLQKSSSSNQLEFLLGSSMQETANGKHLDDTHTTRSKSAAEINGGSRFELLKEVLVPDSANLAVEPTLHDDYFGQLAFRET